MSAYVSVYGTSEVNTAEIRLSIEEQFRQLGINVLPHTAPPRYPVFNLTIKNGTNSHTATTTEYDPTKPVGQPSIVGAALALFSDQDHIQTGLRSRIQKVQ